MICLTKIQQQFVNVGDILIYSEEKAYLIVQNDIEYSAIQIFNNGNEDLGFINYSDVSLDALMERITKDYGVPKRMINIKNIKVEL